MKIISFLSSLFFVFQLNAQTEWELTLESDSMGIYASGIAQINDTIYASIDCKYNFVSDISYETSIFTINQYGSVQDSLIDFPPSAHPFKIFKLKDGGLLTVSNKYTGDGFITEYTKFDDDLSLVWNSAYHLPEGNNSVTNDQFFDEDSDGNLFFILNSSIGVKLSSSGDSLIIKNLSFTGFDLNGFTIIEQTLFYSRSDMLVTSDQNFQFISQEMLPPNVETYGLKNVNDNLLFLQKNQTENEFRLSYHTSEMAFISSQSFPADFSTVYIDKPSLLISEAGNIYVLLIEGDTQIIVKIDENFTELWRIIVTSEVSSFAFKVDAIPTADDGLLINTHFVNDSSPFAAGTYFVKIGPNGEIPLNMLQKSTLKLKAHKVYPNPVSSMLNITFTERLEDATLSIFNSSGEILKENVFSGTEAQISIEEIPPGIYFYTISKNNRKLYSGKWLKE